MKFGYMMKNGETVICEVQIAVYRQAASDYIAGVSLKSKADELTEQKVEYAPGKYNWNKNRVQRMLTDPTYLGTETHPPIIDRETFDKVQEIMQSRNTQKGHQREKVFSSSVVPIICGKCGASTNRRYDARWVNNTVHICSNPECKATYAIGDEALWELVRIKIVAADETEVEPSEEIMTAVRRLTNEIDHDLQGLDVDAETLKNKIFECAALQYAALHIKRRESVDFTEMKPHSPVLIREIKKRVSAVMLDGTEEIRLQMTDGQVIGKENDHATNCN